MHRPRRRVRYVRRFAGSYCERPGSSGPLSFLGGRRRKVSSHSTDSHRCRRCEQANSATSSRSRTVFTSSPPAYPVRTPVPPRPCRRGRAGKPEWGCGGGNGPGKQIRSDLPSLRTRQLWYEGRLNSSSGHFRCETTQSLRSPAFDPRDICADGGCDGPDGLASCAGRCVDATSDEANCGGCGIMCDRDEVCAESECVCACPGGACEEADRFGADPWDP